MYTPAKFTEQVVVLDGRCLACNFAPTVTITTPSATCACRTSTNATPVGGTHVLFLVHGQCIRAYVAPHPRLAAHLALVGHTDNVAASFGKRNSAPSERALSNVCFTVGSPVHVCECFFVDALHLSYVGMQSVSLLNKSRYSNHVTSPGRELISNIDSWRQYFELGVVSLKAVQYVSFFLARSVKSV